MNNESRFENHDEHEVLCAEIIYKASTVNGRIRIDYFVPLNKSATY